MGSQQDPNACQMHEADVVFNLILIAHCNRSATSCSGVQPSIASCKRPTILRFRSGAIATMWSEHLDATLSQCSIQSHTPCRQSDVWVHPPQNNRGLNKFGFVRRSTRYVNGDRKARNCHDLAPFTALTTAAPPFWLAQMCRRYCQVDLATCIQILGQNVQNLDEH
jgi:hypothetical protein